METCPTCREYDGHHPHCPDYEEIPEIDEDAIYERAKDRMEEEKWD